MPIDRASGIHESSRGLHHQFVVEFLVVRDEDADVLGAEGLGIKGERVVAHEVRGVLARGAADEGVAEGDQGAFLGELARDDKRG